MQITSNVNCQYTGQYKNAKIITTYDKYPICMYHVPRPKTILKG